MKVHTSVQFKFKFFTRKPGLCICRVTRLQAERSKNFGSIRDRGKRFFSFCKASIPDTGPTLRTIQWLSGCSFSIAKLTSSIPPALRLRSGAMPPPLHLKACTETRLLNLFYASTVHLDISMFIITPTDAQEIIKN